jgi:alkylation response protein AidB-like acyl-CoA dehydrogenase
MAAALAIGTGAAYLGDSAVAELFSGKRMPVIAGQGTRPGIAVPHRGGFLLSGSWSFASGIKHGTHIHTLGLIEGTNEPRIFVLPVEKARLIDNWDVLGLRGTGSIDYTIDSVYVPDSTRTLRSRSNLGVAGRFTRSESPFACMCHSAWACGIARRALDELALGVRRRAAVADASRKRVSENYARPRRLQRRALYTNLGRS